MKPIRIVSLALAIFISFSFINSCKQLQQITQTLTNLDRLQFKLDNVDDFGIAGIKLGSKSKISDFSIGNALSLTNAFRNKKLPAEFVLNVAAKNPNDGSGKTSSTTATLTSFDWKLYIDNVETISGNINKPIEIPGTGQTSIIPLTMSLDLYEFFGNKGYDGLINLALAIGGVDGSASRLKLDAKPTVSTPVGPISYPGRITILDTKFTN